jgi:hypothetical protein
VSQRTTTTGAATDGDQAAEPLATVEDPAPEADVVETADEADPGGEKHVRLPWETMGLDEDEAPASSTEVAEPDVEADPGDDGPTEFHVHDDTDEDTAVDVRVRSSEEDGDDAGMDADWHWVATHVEYERPVPAEPLAEDLGPAPKGGGWTVTTLCAGVAILACCVLIPQTDANRRLAYEREKLKLDLESVKKQVATNEEFLRRVADDPNLAERLAQRQMKIIRQGTRVLELKDARRAGATDQRLGSSSPAPTPDEVSPFHLVHVPPPPPMPPYEPVGGTLANLCYHPQSRLYLIGTGLLLMAAGLVLGLGSKE